MEQKEKKEKKNAFHQHLPHVFFLICLLFHSFHLSPRLKLWGYFHSGHLMQNFKIQQQQVGGNIGFLMSGSVALSIRGQRVGELVCQSTALFVCGSEKDSVCPCVCVLPRAEKAGVASELIPKLISEIEINPVGPDRECMCACIVCVCVCLSVCDEKWISWYWLKWYVTHKW